MMIRLGRIVMPITTFFLKWHIGKELTIILQDSSRFTQHLRRVFDVFQNVMTNQNVSGLIRNNGCSFNEFDDRLKGGWKKVFDVHSNSPCARELGEVPAEADAEFDHNVGLFNEMLKFFGAQLRDPRHSGGGYGALVLLITPAGFAAIKVFGGAGHR